MSSSQETKSRTIVVPFASIEQHNSILPNTSAFRKFLLQKAEEHPELFPLDFEKGFHFVGTYPSKKLGIKFRYVRLLSNQETYLIHPSSVMPYLVGYTKDLSGPLMLRRWNVPYWVLAHLFGVDASYWQRAYHSFGRNHLVGTTVKTEKALPEHTNADEKHFSYHGPESLYRNNRLLKTAFSERP